VNPDWLAQLAPPHAPPPPGWWPPAPGWWALALLVLMAVAALVYWWTRPPRRLRRAALRALTELERAHLDDLQLARGLQDLLRRHAVARYGREKVARLAGADWLDFMVARGAREFAGPAGDALLRAAYANAAPGERHPWLAGARAFIEARK
jgi:hypothetical protein